MAARRAAFIVAERARPRVSEETVEEYRGARAVKGGEKSLAAAYLYWFFLGGLGGHRFYLGFATSGTVQGSLGFIGLLLIFRGALDFSLSTLGEAMLVILFWLSWVLADAILIISLHEKAKRRSKPSPAQTIA
jgi:TM2 domain-containing membrane protein YozV